MSKYVNLNTVVDEIIKDKHKIVEEWVNCSIANEMFSKTGLGKEKFKVSFAPRVFDYYTQVIKATSPVGDCPVIGAMLALLDKLNIPLPEIFILCVQLKNGLLLHDLICGNKERMKENNEIFDSNLKGVIEEYAHIHMPPVKPINQNIRKVQNISAIDEVNSEHSVVQTKEEFYMEKISAKDFLEFEGIDYEIVQDLDDIELEFDPVFYSYEVMDPALILAIEKLMGLYISALNQMVEFKELYQHATYFVELVNAIDIASLDEDTSMMYYTMIKAVITDFIMWKNEIFHISVTEDIHFLDDSIGSSIEQMAMFAGTSDTESEEIEFF